MPISGPELVKYGWQCNGLVGFEKQWCLVCARERWHEKELQDNRLLCLGCLNVIEPPDATAIIESLVHDEREDAPRGQLNGHY